LTLSPVLVENIWIGKPDGHSTRIFKDKRVFQLDYVPGRVLHREEQVGKLLGIFADLDRGVKPKNVLGLGTYGTGKTVVTRATCQSLPSTPKVVYINCTEDNTRLKILRESLRQLRDDVVKSGYPSDFYLTWFKEEVKKHNWVIVILDEVDRFIEHRDSEYADYFYSISRTIDNVIIIMLTNRANFENVFLEDLDSRVRDTFSWERIEFCDYYANELSDILEARAEIGWNPSTYDKGIVARIAHETYRNGFRARGLIKLGRLSGEIAEAKGHHKIEEEDVAEAINQWTKEHDLEFIRRLPPPARAILGDIHVNSPTANQAYDNFVHWAQANDVGHSRTQFQMWLKELDNLGLVDKGKHPRGRGRGSEYMRLTIKPEMQFFVTRALEQEPGTPSPNI